MYQPELLTEDEAAVLLLSIVDVVRQMTRFGLDIALSEDDRQMCRFFMERLELTLRAATRENYYFNLNLVLKQARLTRKNLEALTGWWWEMKNDRSHSLIKDLWRNKQP